MYHGQQSAPHRKTPDKHRSTSLNLGPLFSFAHPKLSHQTTSRADTRRPADHRITSAAEQPSPLYKAHAHAEYMSNNAASPRRLMILCFVIVMDVSRFRRWVGVTRRSLACTVHIPLQMVRYISTSTLLAYTCLPTSRLNSLSTLLLGVPSVASFEQEAELSAFTIFQALPSLRYGVHRSLHLYSSPSRHSSSCLWKLAFT